MIERFASIVSRLLASRRVTGMAAALLAILGVVPAVLARIQPDTGWYLYAAGRVLDGDRLYVDLVEVNPPLVVWFHTIPVALGRALHLPAVLVLSCLVIAMSLLAAAVSADLLRLLFPNRRILGRAFDLLILFILLPLAREDFGQREHVFLALTLPYVLLTCLRAVGGGVGTIRAVGIGAAAGLGIAFKPHFVLLWLGLEIGLLAATGRLRPRLRPESLVVIAVGAMYLGSTFLWAPQYFEVVRLMAAPYFGFLHNSLLVTAILGDGALLPLVAIMTVMALRGYGRSVRVWTVLSWATVGLWLAAVLQQKGWQYHFYPAFALSLLLLLLAAADARRPVQATVPRLFLTLAVVVLVVTGVRTVAESTLRSLSPRDPRYDEDQDLYRLIPVVREYAAGDAMAMFSWSIASSFPLTNYAGVRLASRFPSLWPLAAIYWRDVHREEPVRYRPRAAMGALERYFENAVVQDFVSAPPRVLVVLWRGRDRSVLRLRRLDYLCYFLRDPRFRSAFARYRYLREVGEYWVFIRTEPGADPPPDALDVPRCQPGEAW